MGKYQKKIKYILLGFGIFITCVLMVFLFRAICSDSSFSVDALTLGTGTNAAADTGETVRNQESNLMTGENHAAAGEDESDWCLMLVNRWNKIPDNYMVELVKLANGESVDQRIYPALQQMFDDMRSAGIYPEVASGYRTREKQQQLMTEKINAYEAEGYYPETAKEKAEAWVAIPGTSEHQLGIAVDINSDGIRSSGEEVYEWLDGNAWKYGFIYRYPSDKTALTGVINEPWHYRYVGIKAAEEIYRQGICLEEYLQ